MIFLLCDAYKAWIEQRHSNSNPNTLFDLEWKFYASLLRSAIEFAAYSCTLCLLLWIGNFKLPNNNGFSVNQNRLFFIESALVSFYGDLFVVFAIIWQLHGQLLYKLLTRIFIVISHVQVQRGNFSFKS